MNNLNTDYSVYLSIHWTGQSWQVSLDNAALNNPDAMSASSDQTCNSISKQLTAILDGCIALLSENPACASFEDQVNTATVYNTTEVDKVAVNWNIVAAKNPAEGCVAAIVPAHDTIPATTPHPHIAYCIYHFGVLLTANALAHHDWPDWPMADAYEQGIAQQTAATIGL